MQRAIAEALLPVQVKRYLSAFVELGADSGLRRLLKTDPARLLADISGLIDSSAKTMGISREEVLFATGFHPGNLAPARLEAALAELRAVNFLAGEGFTAGCFVPSARGKTADITAYRGGNTYAFEVRCVTGDSGAAAADPLKAVSLLVKKYRKKMPQAALSKKKGGFSHCGLVLIINTKNFAPFRESGGLKRLAAAIYEKAGRPPREHICLLSGAETGVFPNW